MAEIFLRRQTGWQADLQRDAIADMYAKTYRRSPGVVLRDRPEFLARFDDHVRQPGFEMVLAAERAPVGCVYGYLVDGRQAWWIDRCARKPPGVATRSSASVPYVPYAPSGPRAPTVLPAPTALTALPAVAGSDEVFVIVELMVLPAHRRNHLATRLQHRLLASHSGMHVAIFLERANVPARSACREWGWHRAGVLPPRHRIPGMEVWSCVPVG